MSVLDLSMLYLIFLWDVQLSVGMVSSPYSEGTYRDAIWIFLY